MKKKVVKIVIVFFMCMLAFIFFKGTNTYASNNNVDLDYYMQDTDEIYDISNPNNIVPLIDDEYNTQYNIDQYKEELYDSNRSVEGEINKVFNIFGDDPIVNIIPREYFLNEGMFKCAGKEYAYFIQIDKCPAYLNGVVDSDEKECFRSRVLIVNLETQLNSDGSLHYEERGFSHKIIQNQYLFYTIDLTNPSIYYPSVPFIEYRTVNFPSNQDNVVIARPNNSNFNVNNYSYFTIHNMNASEQLINQHIADTNQGLYFVDTDIQHHGLEDKSVNDENMADYCIEYLVNFAMLLIPDDLEALDKFITIGTFALDTWELLNVKFHNVESIEDVYAEICSNEEKLFSDDTFYAIKNDQLNYGKLVKDCNIFVYDCYLAQQNDYMNFYFKPSANDDEDKSTYVNTIISFDVYDNFGNKINYNGNDNFGNICFNSTYEYKKNEVSNIALYYDYTDEYSYNNEYNYKYTSQYYRFIPNNTQVYNIEVTNNMDIVLYDSNYNEIPTNSVLEKYSTYYIKVINNSSESKTYSIKIKYPNIDNISSIMLNSHTITYLNYGCNNSGVYFLSTNEDYSNLLYNLNNEKDLEYLTSGSYFCSIENNSDVNYTVTPMVLEPGDNQKYKIYIFSSKGDYQILGEYSYLDNFKIVTYQNKIESFHVDDLIYYKSNQNLSIEKLDYVYVGFVNHIKVDNNSFIVLNLNDHFDDFFIMKKYSFGSKSFKTYYIDVVVNKKLSFNYDLGDGEVFSFEVIPNKIEINSYYIETSLTTSGVNFVFCLSDVDVNLLYYKMIVNGVMIKNQVLKENQVFKININIDIISIIFFDKNFDFYINYIDNFQENQNDCKSFVYDEVKATFFNNDNEKNNFIENNYNVLFRSALSNNQYNITNGLQFLSCFYMIDEDCWISYDDGMNNDSYFIDDAFIYSINIICDIDFNGFTFNNTRLVYLYGYIDGNNHVISNLNLSTEYRYGDNTNIYLFKGNYGTICNIIFKKTNINALFIDPGYGERDNVIISNN